MSYPELPKLPEIVEHLRQHFRECFDCYKLAVHITSKDAKGQLELITQITKMHDESNKMKTRILGADIRVHLRIPERLWEECKAILIQNKIRIDKYVTATEDIKKQRSADAERQQVIRVELEDIKKIAEIESEEPPDLSRIFDAFRNPNAKK